MTYEKTLEYKIVKAMNLTFLGLMATAAVALVVAPFLMIEG